MSRHCYGGLRDLLPVEVCPIFYRQKIEEDENERHNSIIKSQMSSRLADTSASDKQH